MKPKVYPNPRLMYPVLLILLYDYDATPATGRKNADTKYILGIGANF